MTVEEKIEYWTKRLLEDHSDETVREFLVDSEYCFYGSGGLCPVCSHGCFKINVGWFIEQINPEISREIMYRMMELGSKARNCQE